MTSSEQYKRQIMNDLAQGDSETLVCQRQGKNTKNLMICRSSHEERRSCLQIYIQTAYLVAKWSQNSKKSDRPN